MTTALDVGAVIFVMGMAAAVTWHEGVGARPLRLDYLQDNRLILLMPGFVQGYDIVMSASFRPARRAGDLLPLITTNCAVLA